MWQPLSEVLCFICTCHLIFTIAPRSSYCYPHFVYEMADAHRGREYILAISQALTNSLGFPFSLLRSNPIAQPDSVFTSKMRLSAIFVASFSPCTQPHPVGIPEHSVASQLPLLASLKGSPRPFPVKVSHCGIQMEGRDGMRKCDKILPVKALVCNFSSV